MRLRLSRSRSPSRKPHLKHLYRRRLRLSLFFLLISFLFFLYNLCLSLFPVLFPSYRLFLSRLNLHEVGRSRLGGSPGRVTVWPSRGCRRGSWATIPSPYSLKHFPYAVVRDASVDRRPASRAYLASDDPPGTRRIVLYVTTHLSARHSREGSQVQVDGGDVHGNVEYVTQSDREAVPEVKGWYIKGMRTKYLQEVSEWQIGVRLSPAEGAGERAVERAVEMDREMNLSLRVVRFFDEQGDGIPLQVRMGLSCVMGWETPGLERRREVCASGEDMQWASGSVALSAKPLYGERKRDPMYFREVADFAVRALTGPVRFDAVAVAVTSDVSVSEMDMSCETGDDTCREGLEEVNNGMLRRIADAVEGEMLKIGVPSWLFSRVLLIPTCRLGSHANVTEKEDPCRMSKAYGQYQASFSSYAMIAPFFKWAASYDIDEFLSPAPVLRAVTPAPAERILDAADARNESQGHLFFDSIEFHVESQLDSRSLTTYLQRGQLPQLKNQQNLASSGQCYDRLPNTAGKAAVRCDKGLGFTIHYPAVQEDRFGMQVRHGRHADRRIRTWHARLAKAFGKCSYDPQRHGES